ncbi:putative WAT1-related protein, partial [Tanacetum coccineum]
MSGAMNDVPKQVLDVLPWDPFEQIDIARKITSIALSTRVSSLESQSSILLQDIAARDDVIVDLQSHLHSLDFSLSQDLHSLSVADHQKENLFKENASLLETVNKLKRDVAKLETFRKTLMMSLQDEEENLARGPPEYEENLLHPQAAHFMIDLLSIHLQIQVPMPQRQNTLRKADEILGPENKDLY